MNIVEKCIYGIRKIICLFHLFCLYGCIEALVQDSLSNGAIELAIMVFALGLFIVPLDLFVGISMAMSENKYNASDKKVCQIVGSVNRKGKRHRLLLQPVDGSYRMVESKHYVKEKKYPIGGLVNVCFEPCGDAYYIPKVDPLFECNFTYYKLLVCFFIVIVIDLIV